MCISWHRQAHCHPNPLETTTLPAIDAEYVEGTKSPAAKPNAQLIGYVHTSIDGGATRCTVPYADITGAVKTCSRTWLLPWRRAFVVPERAGEDYDQCPKAGGYERYDHAGVGSSMDAVLLPSVGNANAARMAVLVHGFHDYNGPAANLNATAGVLQQMVGVVAQRKIGATFSNTAGYHTFSDRPALIEAVAGLLKAANGVQMRALGSVWW